MIFNRLNFTELWLTLDSNETLGVLDTDYIEDYYGVDGQLTLVKQGTLEEYPVLMNPSNDNTKLSGFIELSSLANGDYILKGRVRDIVGNYTILSGFYLPDAGTIVDYGISIIQSPVYGAVSVNGLTLMGGLTVSTGIEKTIPSASVKFSINESTGVAIASNVGAGVKIEGNVSTNTSINRDELVTVRLS
jgi:hypothetical protein